MKQQLISLFFCGVLLLQGCTEKKNEAQLEKTLSVYQVDLKSESPKESIDRFLAGMEIRLLPLESGDSILFKGSASTIHLADDDIFLLDASQRVIFRFGRDGKFKNKIFRNGQGPEEYNVLFNMALFDNKVYALDNTKIQLYDYEGNYLKTVPLKNDGRQVAVAKDGTIAVASNYIQPYQLTLYRPDGTISEYLPSDKNLLKQQISQSTYHSLKRYGDRILLTNYFDPSIYQLEDTVSAFATLDFKGMNIPSNMFSGTDEEIANRFREYREGDKAILSFDRLTVNACRETVFEEDIPELRIISSCGLNLVEGRAVGTLYKEFGIRPYAKDAASTAAVNLIWQDQEQHTVYYHGGPYFDLAANAEPDILAVYDTEKKLPAIIRQTYGDGQVILSGEIGRAHV